jgi:hypothetical protein
MCLIDTALLMLELMTTGRDVPRHVHIRYSLPHFSLASQSMLPSPPSINGENLVRAFNK